MRSITKTRLGLLFIAAGTFAQSPDAGPETIMWLAGMESVTHDGRMWLKIDSPGRAAMSATVFDNGQYIIAQVAISNQSTTAVDILPERFSMTITEPKSKPVEFIPPDRVPARSGALHATSIKPGQEIKGIVFFKREASCASATGCKVLLAVSVGDTTFIFPMALGTANLPVRGPATATTAAAPVPSPAPAVPVSRPEKEREAPDAYASRTTSPVQTSGTGATGAGSVRKGSRLFVTKMEKDLDGFITAEIMKQKLPIQIVLNQEDAQFVLTGFSQITGSHWAEQVAATIFGGKDKYEAECKMISADGRTLVWSGEAGDRSLIFSGWRRGGQRKIAERIVKQMRESLFARMK